MKGVFKALKRVGTHPQRYQFTITVSALELSKPIGEILPTNFDFSQATISYLWKRGPRSAASKPIPISGGAEQKVFSWEGQSYPLMCTLYQDKDKFQDKEATVRIRVHSGTQEEEKVIGAIRMNLARYVNSNEQPIQDQIQLAKCRDKSAMIRFSLIPKWIKEVNPEYDSFLLILWLKLRSSTL
jgi:hypothetical protein